ncbi:MAG: acyltransferase domain-containing protein [Synechococcaceae cyanobacterium SM2_3_1]|nr:acyltransferase domain-containing protein [Synechococcaceae cyanobacterium SM2_3_1]
MAIQKILQSQPNQNQDPAEVMHPCRLATVVESRKEALEILADFLADQEHPHLYTGSIGSTPAAIAFLFSGHTTQYWGMGKELFQINSVFRQVLEDCDREARNHLQDQSFLDYFFTSPATAFDLDTTSKTLPALFALQCGLVEVWKSWGIQPAFVLGSSVGELAAACTAGCISRADGIRYTVAIGQLLETLPRDCQMLGISGMTEAEVENLISPLVPDISVVAQAGWRNTIVGPPHLLQQILPLIEQAGAGTVDLQSSYGVHTHRIDSLAKELEKLIKGIKFHKPQIPFISTVTGEIAQGEVPPIHYSKEMAQQPVRLSAAIRTCLQHHCQTFLEIGPSIVTLSMGISSVEPQTGHWIPSLRQQQSDWTQMLLSLSQLYVLGSRVHWDQVAKDQRHASGSLGLGSQREDPQMTIHQQVLLSLTKGDRVEAEKVLFTFLQSRIARILHFKSSVNLNAEATLPHLGIDSIMSTELRHQVKAELGIDLPFGLLMKGPTLSQLVAFILETLAPDHRHEQLAQGAISPQ